MTSGIHVNVSEKNGAWRGDAASYASIHRWVRRYMSSAPLFCPCCQRNTPLEVSNISGYYRRDLKDWEWLCHRCNIRKDYQEKRFLGELLLPFRHRPYPRGASA